MARSRSSGSGERAAHADEVGNDAHRGVGEERDRRGAGREAVEAVRQVHPVREARDDDEEEPVPGPRERHVEVHERQVDARLEVCVVDDDRDDGGDHPEQEKLPAAGQPERAPVRQLRPVVHEPDRGTAERDEEGGKRRQRPLREEEERNRHGDHDQEPAHRGRALLGHVARGAFLANVLPELVPAQELDELRAGDDCDHHADDPGEENPFHGAEG